MISRSISNNSSQTKELAKTLVQKIKTSTVICLYGDLGSGKTTFTQGLAEIYGIKRVISPTFILLRSYVVKKKKSPVKMFYHLDLYRLDDVKQIKEIGIGEIMTGQNSIVVIEWAEKMADLLPKKRIDVYFKYLSANKREITVKNYE